MINIVKDLKKIFRRGFLKAIIKVFSFNVLFLKQKMFPCFLLLLSEHWFCRKKD